MELHKYTVLEIAGMGDIREHAMLTKINKKREACNGREVKDSGFHKFMGPLRLENWICSSQLDLYSHNM